MPPIVPADVQTLPTPLILLLHLHILEYPHANNPEYDHHIFNPRTRGIRERAKIMEDIAYFLVGKIEGKNVKSILSTYPCVQPSESLAFRTSLTKYLETLRHQCIYPAAIRQSTKSNLKSSNASLATDAESVASWWKDVVVRKTLLEECSGDKFERLIVSLSTHTLMKASRSIPFEKMSGLVRDQPVAYTTALAVYQAKRHAWTKAASRLGRSELDLTILKHSLNEATTKYHTLPTGKLQFLAESKRKMLLQRFWTGEESESAFAFLVELAGIRSSRASFSVIDAEFGAVSKPAGLPSPLPIAIAAAHHHSHLKRLRRPIFQPKLKLGAGAVPNVTGRPHAEIILAEHIDSEKRMRQTLVDAMSRINRIGLEINERLKTLQSHKPDVSSTLFWTPPTSRVPMNFDPVPNKELLILLGMNAEYEALDVEDTLERKIERIRSSLPPYPAMPDQSAPRKPPLNGRQAEGNSKLPQTTRYKRTRSIPESTDSSSLLKAPNADGPATPLMSPNKSSRSIRRKSVRFTMAQKRTERPSVFRVFSGDLQDEVDRLVDETNDFPTDDEETDNENFDASPFITSRSKVRPLINKIWTAGTPMKGRRSGFGQGTPKLRVPSALTRMLDMGPSVSLPSMPSSAALDDAGEEHDMEGSGERDWGVGNVDATPRPLKKDLPLRRDGSHEEDSEDENVFDEDPPSMTLKDILLSVDTSQFDLLEASSEEIEEAMVVDDTSFIWG